MVRIEARRWFQKSYGNTYHSVKVYRNKKLIGHEPFTYGYGDQWIQTAQKFLPELETPTLKGLRDIGATYSLKDVKRKKDL